MRNPIKRLLEYPGKKPTALPMRDFQDYDEKDYTWEDYYEEMKAKHPVRYFVNETLSMWIHLNIVRPLNDVLYYIKSHVVPSRRYHMLDLRQQSTVGNDRPYRYGWIDSDTQIEYAIGNILAKFVEDEQHTLERISRLKELVNSTDNDDERACLESDLASTQKIYNLYTWWTRDRIARQVEYDTLLHNWSLARDSGPATTEWEQLNALELLMEEEKTEKLCEIMRIRRCMWT